MQIYAGSATLCRAHVPWSLSVRYLRRLVSWFVAALFLQLMCLSWVGAAPINAGAGRAGSPAVPRAEGKAVLILSGVQFGLPTSDVVVGGAVTALQEKGVASMTSTSNTSTSFAKGTPNNVLHWPRFCNASWRMSILAW